MELADTLFICGGSSTALEIADMVTEFFPNCQITHAVGDREDRPAPHYCPQSAVPDAVRRCSSRPMAILSMTDPAIRRQWLEVFANLPADFTTLIHPDATVAPSAKVGRGSFIAAGARVSTAATVGEHNLINLNATVGHHAVTGHHVIINPAAAVSGMVTIGDRTLLGAHAFLFQGISVGNDCKVDAMAYVRDSVPAGHLVSSRPRTQCLRRIDLPANAFSPED